LERSLTVLLPVYNVESTLTADVTEVLDVASDLTERFELVIIDDGSADATSEVIDELTRFYPQVRSVRHGEHRGRDEAIRTGLEHSTGEMILLRDAPSTEKRIACHVLDRKLVEQIHRNRRPAGPNYLTHLPPPAPTEQINGVPTAGSHRA